MQTVQSECKETCCIIECTIEQIAKSLVIKLFLSVQNCIDANLYAIHLFDPYFQLLIS